MSDTSHTYELPSRVKVLEDAVMGLPHVPGLLELARNQTSRIDTLEKTITGLNEHVLEVREDQKKAMLLKEGEQRAFNRFRNVAYFLLLLLGAGGTVLGGRIIAILDALK